MWQDIVFSVANILFIAALVPSIKGKDKPAITTSLMNSGIIAAIAITYLSLNLYYSALFGFITSLMWLYLAWQVYGAHKLKKKK